MKSLFAGLLAIVILAGCETKTETGALVGGAIGVGAGAIIGQDIGGAAVGGAVGALAGGAIGYAMEKQDRKTMEKKAPDTLNKIDRGEQLSIRDVEKMSSAGINDDVIINQIKATNSVFYLSADDIVELKNAGVSQHVINYMIETGK